jgi:uracil-DNA glycosylase
MPSVEMEKLIFEFAERLQHTKVPSDVNNFYAADRTNIQRHNLLLYLRQMAELKPDTLLVGEAPGYNGCARTGVPFSSEKLLREGVQGGRLFGAHNGYLTHAGTAVHEQSAAAMWEALEAVDNVPLLWNAYPFHPHRKENPCSNRKPRSSELFVGREFLEEIIVLFRIKKLVAVGNAADEVLQKIGLEHSKVRHPSHGGKSLFTEQVSELLKPVAKR